jgi:hypothetical protein
MIIGYYVFKIVKKIINIVFLIKLLLDIGILNIGLMTL